MAQDKIKAPALTDAIKSAKLSDMIKFFGPGAIIASLTIGSGETFSPPGAERSLATPSCGPSSWGVSSSGFSVLLPCVI